jgi:hypothetical protein
MCEWWDERQGQQDETFSLSFFFFFFLFFCLFASTDRLLAVLELLVALGAVALNLGVSLVLGLLQALCLACEKKK